MSAALAVDFNQQVRSVTGKQWSPRDCLVYASSNCSLCGGTGVRNVQAGQTVCACVYRYCFRAVLGKYHQCRAHSGLRTMFIAHGYLPNGRKRHGELNVWTPHEDYVADVEIQARQMLSTLEADVFFAHHVEGREWRDCVNAVRGGLDRGSFFHTVYRIEERLGRHFAELEPYPLLPWRYFVPCDHSRVIDFGNWQARKRN